MDQFQGFPSIQALFLSDFHPVQGPRVRIDVPETFTHGSHMDFDSLSEYIIPKPELCNRLVILSTQKYKIVGYPVSIESQKYERNAFIFNLSFVFSRSADVTAFIPIVKKMARILKTLEVNLEFLSLSDHQPSLLNILEQLLEDLNNYSECQIPIDDSNIINLKLFPKYLDPPEVKDYQVPVCIINLENVMDKYWDMTMRRVISYVNGVDYVKRIADKADVHPSLLRLCIRHLLYYGCVKMVDIFQFSNMYAVAKLNNLLSRKELQDELVEYCTIKDQAPVPFSVLFQLYASLRLGITIQQWIHEQRVYEYPIYVRRFILFGVIKGYIYRIHKYPIVLQQQDPDDPVDPRETKELSVSNILRLLDGSRHYDELCVMFSCSVKELDSLLASIPNIKFIYK